MTRRPLTKKRRLAGDAENSGTVRSSTVLLAIRQYCEINAIATAKTVTEINNWPKVKRAPISGLSICEFIALPHCQITPAITQPEQLTRRKSITADRGLGVHRLVRACSTDSPFHQ
jgi:hypothetical protein